MIIRINVFVGEEGFDYILIRNRFGILLFSFFWLDFYGGIKPFLSSTKVSLEGHFKYLFFILDLSISALISCLVIKGNYFHGPYFALKVHVYQPHL